MVFAVIYNQKVLKSAVINAEKCCYKKRLAKGMFMCYNFSEKHTPHCYGTRVLHNCFCYAVLAYNGTAEV